MGAGFFVAQKWRLRAISHIAYIGIIKDVKPICQLTDKALTGINHKSEQRSGTEIMVRQEAQLSTVEKHKGKTYADLIIHYLLQIDVDYIFGVPGGAIEPLYNAIGRNLRRPLEVTPKPSPNNNPIPMRKRHPSMRIRPVIARHETGAAFMADGYTRETGKLGVCCATTGPGATNLITGVASAYADRIPMLVITPQTALPSFGKSGLQESSSDAVDIVGMFEHCTRYNSLVSHPNQLEGKLYKALLHAFRSPRGPVHLSIPMDILNAPFEREPEDYQIAHLFRRPKTVDGDSYQALLCAIKQAKKKILFVGGECKHFMSTVIAFAEQTNTLIVTTPSGKSMINNYHPLYRGVFGFAGHESAYKILRDEAVDLIIAVGTPLGELSTSGWDKAILNNKLVHISAVEDDFDRSPMAYLHTLGDAATIFDHLCNDLFVSNFDWDATTSPSEKQIATADESDEKAYLPSTLKFQREESLYSNAVPLKPQRVMYELATRFPANTRFMVDAGNAWAWTTHYMMLTSVGLQRTAFGFGAMGWAIGAAVGTALGCRGEPVVCITGDGSYLMSAQEISVAVAEHLPMLFIVLNDQALGMVKHGQRLSGAEAIGYKLPPVDFSLMARAQGVQAFTIRTAEELQQLDLEQIFSADRPTLLDIYIDSEETPPMASRVKTLVGVN